MVDLLLETGSLAQAVALMRELLVSWVCLEEGLDPLKGREPAEKLLGTWGSQVRGEGKAPQEAELGKLWNELTDIRNDILHASMRKSPTPAESLQRRIQALWPRVRAGVAV